MTEIADITLNGDPFMLLPGGYERGAEAAAPAKPGRLSLSTFGRGLGLVADDDRAGRGDFGGGGWDGAGVHSVNAGGGLEPWPGAVSYSDAALLGPPSATARAFHQAAGNAVYIAMGRYFYETPALNAANWTGLTLRHTLAAGQAWTDATYYRDDVLLPRGGAADALRWDTGSATMSTWRVGESATVAQGYNGSVIYNQGASGLREQLSYGILHNNGTALRRWRFLDAPQVRLGMFAGKVAVATKQSLYLISGQVSEHINSAPNPDVVWEGDPEPLFTHGTWLDENAGDLRFLASYLGCLYTWLGGSVVQYDPGEGRNGWRAVGPKGRNCLGGCVAGGHLIVTLETGYGQSELWAFDGAGWWLIAAAPAPGAMWPVSLAGAGGYDLLVFASGSTTYRLYRLFPRSTALTSFATAASWTSPLITAGNADTVKAWRKVAAYFVWPEANGNPASGDAVSVSLSYSTNAGASFTVAATASVSLGNSQQLEFELPVPIPTSRFLQLKVEWASVADWAPVLSRLIVDYVLLDTSPRRRRWKVKAVARDRNARRDSGVLAGSGRAQIEALWAAWESRTPVTFRDTDYDAHPVERTVRVLDIRESTDKPSDAGRWGEAVVELELAQV